MTKKLRRGYGKGTIRSAKQVEQRDSEINTLVHNGMFYLDAVAEVDK